MSSSPIDAILPYRPTGTTTPTAVTDGERQGLLAALAAVADPRDPRGVRYPLTSMLATAVCAVMAGACTFAAMADWVDDLDPPAWAKLGFTDRLPVATTLWRLLTRIDAQALSAVLNPLGALTDHTRGGVGPLLADGDRDRRQSPAGNEAVRRAAGPPAVGLRHDRRHGPRTRADRRGIERDPSVHATVGPGRSQLGSLVGIVFVADAMHAQTAHARAVAARGAYLMVAAKANQPALFTQLKQLPWAAVAVGDRTRDTGHGRRETRTVKALTVPDGLGFPHAEQAVRITRTRTIQHKTTRETAYLVVSLPAEHRPTH